jgi:DNA-binding beta-propeller fold protein YncE
MRNARVLAAAALLAAGCAHAPKPADVVWPDPPDVPRIKFVRYFKSDKDLNGDSFWEGVSRALVGNRRTTNAFARPLGIAVSDDGERLYVADILVQAIFALDLKAKTMKRFAEDEVIGDPFGVALDGEEHLYVSDSKNRRVYVFDTRTQKKLLSIAKDPERPTGVAIDRKRQFLYVVDSGHRTSDHKIWVYSLKGELLRTIGRRGQDPGQFNYPTYVALDPDGFVYVADTLNFRIQKFDPEGNFVRTFGEQGDVPGTFNKIKGIAFDGFGNLYVVDSEASAVQMFNKDFQFLMYFGGPAPKIEFFEVPAPIAIEPRTNTIYVGDGGAFARINAYQLINTSPEDSFKQVGAHEPTVDHLSGAPRPGVVGGNPQPGVTGAEKIK